MGTKAPWSRLLELCRRLGPGPAPRARLRTAASAAWRVLRAASGDDAYERYLAHYRLHHGGEGAPMSRAEYFRAEQRRKWDGVRRCC